MTIPRGYFLVQQWFCHYPLLNIVSISWGLNYVCVAHFLNKYAWVSCQMRKKQGYQIQPGPGTRSYYMDPGPQSLAPDPYVLLVIMTFLHKSMLLVLLVHCFCECSCFEVNSITEKFNSVLPILCCCFPVKTC